MGIAVKRDNANLCVSSQHTYFIPRQKNQKKVMGRKKKKKNQKKQQNLTRENVAEGGQGLSKMDCWQ